MADLTIRATTKADLAEVDALLARSYPALLKSAYPPSVLVSAIPLISRARPRLLASGRYFAVCDDAGHIVGAGGVTSAPPKDWRAAQDTGHIRHVVTDPARTRQGIGRRLMTHLISVARRDDLTRLDCLSTLPAVPFYAALGFREVAPVVIELRRGIDFPSVHMQISL